MAAGRWISLSPTRRLLDDFLCFGRDVPVVIVDRRMNLAPLVAARLECARRPSWCALFIRGFGLVAARRPELRRLYMGFPWTHLYEHHKTIAAIAIARTWDGEEAPLLCRFAAPEEHTLLEIDAWLRHQQTCPVEEMPAHRQIRRLSRLPSLMRRMLTWAVLNVRGATRARYAGTFAISSPAAQGAGIVSFPGVLCCTLHYGLLDGNGCLDMRLSFDHRVFDGAVGARALVDLERVLLDEVLTEVRGIRQAPPRAA